MRHTLLFALVLLIVPAAAGEDGKPRVLVTGFQVTGKLLQDESNLDISMEVVTEAILAERYGPISGDALDAACKQLGIKDYQLHTSAANRLAAAKEVGAKHCLTGWACSFGDRVVIVLERIDVEAGLPGRVATVTTEGLDQIPKVLAKLLGMLGMAGDDVPAPADRPDTADERTWDLRKIFARMPEDDLLDTYPNGAYTELIELREYCETPFCDAETWRHAEVLLVESLKHMGRLHTEKGYIDEWIPRLNVLRHPVLGEIEYEVARHGPYLVFVEGSGEPREELLRTLGRVPDAFSELVGDAVELPDFPTSANAHERMLKVFVFTNRSTFNEYQKAINRPLPPGVSGYYSLSDQWLMIYLPISEGGAPLGETGAWRIAHEATHQLCHLYAKILLGRELGEEVLWTDPRLRSKASWLYEGIAELVGSAAASPGKLDLGGAHAVRQREWGMTRSRRLAEWTFKEIIQITSIGELRNRARRKGLGQEARLSSLFFAQAWSFCHFLWSAEDGKYRGKLRELLKRELHGKSGYDEFKKVMFGEGALDERDIVLLEQEWKDHAAALLAEVKPR